MLELYDADTGELVGEITERQLQQVTELLAEEVVGDREYHVDASRLDRLEAESDDAELIELLREALRDREAIRVRWEPA